MPAKVRLVKAMVFPLVMYGCESWTVKKAECLRINAFELAFRDTVPGEAGACLACKSLGLRSLREKHPGAGEPGLRGNLTPQLPATASALWYQRSDSSIIRAIFPEHSASSRPLTHLLSNPYTHAQGEYLSVTS